jgi:hypothetical protein
LVSARRVSPNGWIDLLRQIVLFCGAYWLYRLVRGQVTAAWTAAFRTRAEVILDRALAAPGSSSRRCRRGDRARMADRRRELGCTSTRTSSITTTALAWIYLRRNESFYFVRNMFCVAMGIALVGYMVFPTAPPRMMPEWGFTDSVARLTGRHRL